MGIISNELVTDLSLAGCKREEVSLCFNEFLLAATVMSGTQNVVCFFEMLSECEEVVNNNTSKL